MKVFSYTLALICLFTGTVLAQSLEDNVNVVFMKAQVLYDTDRYDEAVRMYNQILNDNEDFAPAYLMRAKAKYELGAYKGTKEDVMQFILLNGVTKEVIKLMGQTEQQLGNDKAAMNYLNTAIELDPYDAELYLIKGYILFTQKDKSEACELWEQSSRLGDRRAKALLEEHCALILEMKEMRAEEKAKEEAAAKEEMEKEAAKADNDISEEDGDNKNTEEEDLADNEKEVEKPVIIEAPDRDAIQEVEIDEELSVVIGNGLGKRKLDSSPDLLIISDQAGKVVIDVCVDEQGKVIDTSINKSLTTLFKTCLLYTSPSPRDRG